MKTRTTSCLHILILLILFSLFSTSVNAETARVVELTNDNKIQVRLISGKTQNIKFQNVAVPENNKAAEMAGLFLKFVLDGYTVTLAAPKNTNQENSFFVYDSGKFINKEIIKAGWARFEATENNDKINMELQTAEISARANNRGIWADPEKYGIKNARELYPPENWPKTLRIGVVPQGIGKESASLYGKMERILSVALNTEVEIILMNNYEEVIKGLLSRSIQSGYLGAYSYVKTASLIELRPAAIELGVTGTRGYHSIIITNGGSGINDIQDAKGKTLAFSDSESTSGYQIPSNYFILDLGVSPASFAGSVVFAGNHRKVIEGVLSGEYDIGATNDRDLVRATTGLDLKVPLTILWTSRNIPSGLFCVNQDCPDDLLQAFTNTLINLKDEEILKGMNIGGYDVVEDPEYDIIREIKK